LPDLDVFLPYAGEVEAFTYHRGFSHSLLVHIIVSPILAWLLAKVHPISKATTLGSSDPSLASESDFRASWFRWAIVVFLCLSTHALLDACTVYGTQLMWPITEYPVGTSNLFIIDPLYTLPLLFAFIVLLVPKTSMQFKQKTNYIALGLSSIYIAWSFAAKVIIDNKVEQALVINNIDSSSYMSTPAPLNTLLWRIVAVQPDEQGYYEIYASVFDSPEQVSLTYYPSQASLIESISDDWRIKRLRWFTKGVYAISQDDSKVLLSDLRMGIECAYVFNFAVGQIEEEQVVIGDFEKISQRPDLSGVSYIWQRIWDPSVVLSPAKPCD
jgi:inner membrane protein